VGGDRRADGGRDIALVGFDRILGQLRMGLHKTGVKARRAEIGGLENLQVIRDGGFDIKSNKAISTDVITFILYLETSNSNLKMDFA
jgi:hypothetical protein